MRNAAETWSEPGTETEVAVKRDSSVPSRFTTFARHLCLQDPHFIDSILLQCLFTRRPPKMSRPDGRERKMVTYENLDHIGSKFLLHYDMVLTAEIYPMRQIPILS